MAKLLKKFKRNKANEVIEPEVLGAEEDLPDTLHSSPTLGAQSVRLLDQLEKAGFAAIASKLRELQITQGLDALDPMAKRIARIEQHIDELLDVGHPIDTDELKQLLSMAVEAYQARAKAFLLPYGTVSPRTALQGNKGVQGVNVNIGIGTGVTPRAKE